MVELNRQAWAACLEVLFSPNPRGLEALGESVRTAVKRTLTIMEWLEPYLKQAEDQGQQFVRRADFDKAVAETKRLAQEIEVQWPFSDANMAAGSRRIFSEETIKRSRNLSMPPKMVLSQTISLKIGLGNLPRSILVKVMSRTRDELVREVELFRTDRASQDPPLFGFIFRSKIKRDARFFWVWTIQHPLTISSLNPFTTPSGKNYHSGNCFCEHQP